MVDSDLTHPNDRLSGQVRHWLRSGLVFTPDENGNGAGDGTLVGKPSDGVPALTEYLECAPGPPVSTLPPLVLAHRYIFILARESSTSAPQPTDFPSTQLTHAPSVPKDSENLADRAGFNVHEYLEKKGMPVVGVTYMFVAPDVESLVDNVGIMAGTVVDKVMGR
ncbi:hypothetical protein QFC24_006733 [Naganishia onofrii]|uniref:Uncharacterized protein n=1 Tax=Naganishia onofrii TaxID=1851511 RepID=A0ACC2WXJ3_9TREE|nr:hypothetical protein QFC24_006733 [Naganishia onofrii]